MDDPSGDNDRPSASETDDSQKKPFLAEEIEAFRSTRFVDSPERAAAAKPIADPHEPTSNEPTSNEPTSNELVNEPAENPTAGATERVAATIEPAVSPSDNVPSAGEAGADPGDSNAINELRAATTAAGTRTPKLSPDLIAEITRLHEVRLEAEHSARRMLAKPRARRRLHDAITEETDALHFVGFATFDEFAATHVSSTPVQDEPHGGSTETIARIAEMLGEIGIDPGQDPLEAARAFLSSHEAEAALAAAQEAPLANKPASDVWAAPPAITRPAAKAANPWETIPGAVEAAKAAARAAEQGSGPAAAPWVTPPVSSVPQYSMPEVSAPAAETVMPEVPMPETAIPEVPVADTAAPEAAVPEAAEPEAQVPEPEVPEAAEPEAAVPDAVVPEAAAPDAAPEVAVPEVPEAPAPMPRVANERDDDVVDRWISAEARAERMHAEVDRAQAELVALLARSTELEQTVVERSDERNTAHAELELTRARVAELEHSVARSDTERGELEHALAGSRDRIAELEGIVVEREQACAEATRDRAAALETVAELEANLAARTLELEHARTSVADLETELAAQAANFEQVRGELDTARAEAGTLVNEVENTRRSLDALDEHAEKIEAELAEARRQMENPEIRRELDAVRQELAAARTELDEIEARRHDSDATIARDRAELLQLQRELTTTRDATENVRSELSAARSAFDATSAQVTAAERAREAITIDAADLLARAEAEAANLLERAARDAEAMRQQAMISGENHRASDADAIPELVEQVAKLERKLAKQRRRLDRIISGRQDAGAAIAPRSAAKSASRHKGAEHAGGLDTRAADVISAAEREATQIRLAARRDREKFREELMGLLSRLAPVEDDEYDDEDD